MCLIVVSSQPASQYPFVLAANRDEMYDRPTQAAHFWTDSPDVLGGRDLQANGSWLGLNRDGRFAAVTNYRSGIKNNSAALSRGLLVSRFLQGQQTAEIFLQQCLINKTSFNEFNLLLGDTQGLYFLSSRENAFQRLPAGLYGISNGDFDSDWPKVRRAKKHLQKHLHAKVQFEQETLFAMLADRETAADKELPDTGLTIEQEKNLSSIFIQAEAYGTRASTIISIDRQHKATFSERNYDNQGSVVQTQTFDFDIVEQV